jgi:hypothetical protein
MGGKGGDEGDEIDKYMQEIIYLERELELVNERKKKIHLVSD